MTRTPGHPGHNISFSPAWARLFDMKTSSTSNPQVQKYLRSLMPNALEIQGAQQKLKNSLVSSVQVQAWGLCDCCWCSFT